MNTSFFKNTATTTSGPLPKLLLGLLLVLSVALVLQACGSDGREDDRPQPTPVTAMATSALATKPSSTVDVEEAQPQSTPATVMATSAPTPKPSSTVDVEEAQPQSTPATVMATSAPTPKPSSTVDVEEAQPQPTPVTVTPTPRPCPAYDAGNAEPVDKDVLKLACENSNFAFDLYRALSDGEANLFFSPFSISQVLAMAYAGARGETERQMADTLRYSLPQKSLHPAFHALDLALHSKGGTFSVFNLNIANAVWGQEGFEFHEDYLNTLAEHYGGEMRPLDFADASEESRVRINDWVAKETEDKIKDLIPRNAIDSLTRFVLTNAINFNAKWRLPFNPADTKEQRFHLLDGKKVDVPMMTGRSTRGWFGYALGDGFQAVSIPYYTSGMSMLVLLPDNGKFEDFENSLTAGILDLVQKQWEERDVTLNMPRFEYASDFKLNETLAKMGMPDSFGDAADFSGIIDSEDLFISAVVHKAFVSVDEEGTEAAAATALVGMLLGARDPLEPITITFDRPFIFLIRDEPTGTILFLGRVMDPS